MCSCISVSYFCLYCCCVVLFFFFSSRRRHTRYIGDWSSDVCSSDLLTTSISRCKTSWRCGPPPRNFSGNRSGRRIARQSTLLRAKSHLISPPIKRLFAALSNDCCRDQLTLRRRRRLAPISVTSRHT